jgi:sterol desaturase/sphingolipid hydroxylase (fatty acid hydroxylase superfamily)
MVDSFVHYFSVVQEWLFESALQPALFELGLGNLLEDGYEATAWLLAGVIQIVVLIAVIGPLQRLRPVEPVTDRRAVRTDILYTLVHRLGLFRVALFFTLEPVFDSAFGSLRAAGFGTFHLDQLWPGVTDQALVSFAIYLVVFDFVAYWTHRGQHQFEWWWRLHSLHHSQRQMTMWTDNRNHLLDDLLVDVAPGQFIAIVAFTQLSESFQHANLRVAFGRIGERLWVSPRFHRLHHAVGLGHESAGRNTLGGSNFGVLLPWWDVFFGTANFERRFDATGVRDQIEQGRDYGCGFWAQQWLGLKRLAGRA